MTPIRKQETLELMAARRVGAIIRASDTGTARAAMQAAVEGGFRMVEFTLTTPGALDLVEEFARDPELLVGAGTVLTTVDARRAVRAGARFVVSPITDPEVIGETHLLGAVAVPGAYTPTEMMIAVRAGADVVKLFPAVHDVPLVVRQIRGPLPDLRIFPTAGVTLDNFGDILRAGAFGVGFVAPLFTPEDLAAGNWGAIRSRAAEIHRRLAALPG